MKFKNQIFFLLSISLFFTSCNGKVKTNTESQKKGEQKTIPNELPKMIKTQGHYSFMAYNGPHSDTNVNISSIIEDMKGNIWIATMGEGVYRFNGKTFANFTATDGLISNVVFSILEDKDGNLWFGTSNGVSRYNGKSFTSYPFSVIKGNQTNDYNPRTEVLSMLQDKKGNIWLGTTNGVYCYNSLTFTNILELGTLTSPLKSNDSSIRVVTDIIQDKEGNIWFTSWFEGLCRFDGKFITNFKNEGLVNNDGLLQDGNGNIWIGRRGAGVCLYDGKTFKNLFVNMAITEIQEDRKGNIWFATFDRKKKSGSIVCYNPTTDETVSQFTVAEENGNNNISCFAIDKSGNIWFGTDKMTLNKYDGKTFTTFSQDDK